MDPKLAELYGTGSVDEADLEKLAAAELAESLAAEQGVDLSGMDPEDIEALAQEVLGGGVEDGQEKLAEADYLGRVMAHAYAQESREIEKTAGELWNDTKKHVGRGWSRYKELMKGGKGPITHVGKRSLTEGRPGNILGAHFRGGHKAEAWKSTGTRAGTAGAAAAAGYGAYRAGKKVFGKKKRSSVTPALDQLAEARAQEILESQGGGDEYEVLQSAVDQRALEMLAEAGYDVE